MEVLGAGFAGHELERGTDSTADCIHIFWIAGMSCDGCTVALTGASNPSIERLLRGALPGLPRVVLHHPLFAAASGSDFLEPYRRAARGELGAPYMVVVEGSATEDARAGDGYWSALGSGGTADPQSPRVDGVLQPLRSMEWVRSLAPGAFATLALGTCAAWGGVPAGTGNPMGAQSLGDLLGTDYRSKLGLPVVAIPGCAPVGDNIVETLAAVLLYLRGLGPPPELDDLGRPAWLFDETVHRRCVKAGFYEEGVFARSFGEEGCLVELGCWGAVVQCNITSRGAIHGMGGCMNVGGACNGCTMPGFPDAFSDTAESAAWAGAATQGHVGRATAWSVDAGAVGLQRLPVINQPLDRGRLLEVAAAAAPPQVWTFLGRDGPASRDATGEWDAWGFWSARNSQDDAVTEQMSSEPGTPDVAGEPIASTR
jgi:hydrogenase small subunit